MKFVKLFSMLILFTVAGVAHAQSSGEKGNSDGSAFKYCREVRAVSATTMIYSCPDGYFYEVTTLVNGEYEVKVLGDNGRF
jgi:hypothetical protein